MHLAMPHAEQSGSGLRGRIGSLLRWFLGVQRGCDFAESTSSAVGQATEFSLLHSIGQDWDHELFAEIRRRVFAEVLGPNGE
jgi:hypothetical protein